MKMMICTTCGILYRGKNEYLCDACFQRFHGFYEQVDEKFGRLKKVER